MNKGLINEEKSFIIIEIKTIIQNVLRLIIQIIFSIYHHQNKSPYLVKGSYYSSFQQVA